MVRSRPGRLRRVVGRRSWRRQAPLRVQCSGSARPSSGC